MVFDKLEKQSQENLANLLDRIRRNICCVFVGAGLSHPARYPLWVELLETLKNETQNFIGEKINDTHLDYYERAEEYRNRLGKDRFRTIIQREFDPEIDKQPYLPIHLDLLELPFTSFITTNYDCVLEHACVKLGIKPVYNYYPLLPISHLRDRQIYHIHGVIDYSRLIETQNSIILTRSDFDEAYNSGTKLMDLLTCLYTELTIVFIGFDVNDLTIRRIIKSILLEFEKTRKVSFDRGVGPIKKFSHYAFLPYPIKRQSNDDLEVKKLGKEIDLEAAHIEDEELKSNGVYTIRYVGDAQNHTQLINIIHQMNVIISGVIEHQISPDLTFREV